MNFKEHFWSHFISYSSFCCLFILTFFLFVLSLIILARVIFFFLIFLHLTSHIWLTWPIPLPLHFPSCSPRVFPTFFVLFVFADSCTRSWVSATRPSCLVRPTSVRVTRSSAACWLRKTNTSCNSRPSYNNSSRNKYNSSSNNSSNRLSTRPSTPHQTDKPTLR